MPFTPSDPGYAERVRRSFEAQALMRLIGATLERVEPGEVDIGLPFREDLTQQRGFLHAAVVTAIADSACGYAAHTLMPAESEVLSVDFQVNLLRPARGSRFLARAVVLRPGRTLTVSRAEVTARDGEGEAGGRSSLVAVMTATLIRSGP